VKTLQVVLALGAAFGLQTQLRGVLVLGTAPLDLGLIAVIYLSLTLGPTVGLLAGMCAGLAQDALSGGMIIGIGGLANTVVGYVVGLASLQFIVAGPLPRFVAFFVGTLVHAVIFMGLYELLGLAHFGFPWVGIVGQGLANAVVGIVILAALELLPGATERRRGRRDRGGGFRASRRLD
jgi:rod shape-determining protein MreD